MRTSCSTGAPPPLGATPCARRRGACHGLPSIHAHLGHRYAPAARIVLVLPRRLGKPDVTTAFDNREDYNKTPTRENRVAMLQAAATDLLTSLFASASARDRSGADASSEPAGAAERAAADAARAVDPSHFSDETHFPTLSEQAAAAAAANAAAGALGGTWGNASASASLTNGAMRGPAARINFNSAEQFPSLGGGGGPSGGGSGEAEAQQSAAATSWAAAGARTGKPAGVPAAQSAASRISAAPPTAADFPSLGGGSGGGGGGSRGCVPSLSGCSARAPWAEAALQPARKKVGAAPPGSAGFDYDNNEYMRSSAEPAEPPARPRKPQGPPPRVDDEASFPGLAAAVAASAAAAAQASAAAAGGGRQQQQTGATGARQPQQLSPELAEIAKRSAQALTAVRAALTARAAGREARAVSQLVSAGEAEVRRLCAKLQGGELAAEAFLTKFQAVVGGKEAAAALLPQLISLLPDAQGRKAVGLCYAAAYLRSE